MAIVFIGMGSNQGDRMQILKSALLDMKKNVGFLVQSSSIYETPAWGFESESPFLNAVVKFETEHKPLEILNILRFLEEKSGRKRAETGNYIDRTLDLDLLYYDDLLLDEPTLQVPHPRISERKFVLVPLNEIESGWFDVFTQKTVGEMLEDTSDTSEIKHYSEYTP